MSFLLIVANKLPVKEPFIENSFSKGFELNTRPLLTSSESKIISGV
jgi:hypothetical protein